MDICPSCDNKTVTARIMVDDPNIGVDITMCVFCGYWIFDQTGQYENFTYFCPHCRHQDFIIVSTYEEMGSRKYLYSAICSHCHARVVFAQNCELDPDQFEGNVMKAQMPPDGMDICPSCQADQEKKELPKPKKKDSKTKTPEWTETDDKFWKTL